MLDLARFSFSDAAVVRDLIQAAAASSATLEESAQRFVSALHGEIGDASALVRLYCTLPHGELPSELAQFAGSIAEGAGGTCQADTPVLTLMGSAGVEPEWNDRRTSSGHRAIPLLSSEFVDEVPMIAGMLSQFGVDTGDSISAGIGNVCKATSDFAGVFFVQDAATHRDGRGRKVIPAQDFVDSYGVHSVMGSGGTHYNGSLVVLILFTRERLQSDVATLWGPMVSSFVAANSARFERGQRFGD